MASIERFLDVLLFVKYSLHRYFFFLTKIKFFDGVVLEEIAILINLTLITGSKPQITLIGDFQPHGTVLVEKCECTHW